MNRRNSYILSDFKPFKQDTNETIRKYVNTETLNYVIHSIRAQEEKPPANAEEKTR